MTIQTIRILLCLILGVLVGNVPTADTSDPCQGSSSICGVGAKCQSSSNLAICVCPEDTVGDPFVSCRPAPMSSTTTHRNNGMTTTTMYTSSSPSSPHYSSSTSAVEMPTSTSSHYTSQSLRPTTYSDSRFTYTSNSGSSSRDSTPSSSTTVYSPASGSSPAVRSHLGPIAEYPSGSRYNNNDNSNNNNHNSYYNRPHSDDNNDRYRGHHSSSNNNYESTNNRYGSDSQSYRNNYHDDNYSHRPSSQGFSNNNNNNNFMHRNSAPDHSHDNGIRRHDDDNKYDNYRNRNYQDSSSNPIRPINGHHIMDNSHSDYNHHRKNDHPGSGSSFRDSSLNSESVRDPLGVYSNCKTVNGIVVCADENNDSGSKSSSTVMRDNPSQMSSSTYYSGSRHDNTNMNMNMNRHQDSKPSSYNNNNDYENRRMGQNEPMSNHHQEFVVRNDERHQSSSYSKSQMHMDDERRGSAINHHVVPQPQPGNPEQCQKYCGVNSVCRMLLGRPICGCPEGFTGDPSVRCTPAEDQITMANRCLKPTDCAEHMVCEHGQCLDPCKKSDELPASTSAGDNNKNTSNMQEGLRNTFAHYHPPSRNNHSRQGKSRMSMAMAGDSSSSSPIPASGRDRGSLCGRNTKCQVIQHTALCGCLDGFTGNPYMGCV